MTTASELREGMGASHPVHGVGTVSAVCDDGRVFAKVGATNWTAANVLVDLSDDRWSFGPGTRELSIGDAVRAAHLGDENGSQHPGRTSDNVTHLTRAEYERSRAHGYAGPVATLHGAYTRELYERLGANGWQLANEGGATVLRPVYVDNA